MPDRPYKCPLCHSAFRNESRMKWHLAHRHEIPSAIDAIGKDYEARTASLRDENARLRRKVVQLQRELDETKLALLNETNEKLGAIAQVLQFNNALQKAVFALFARDTIIKERLNIELPNPFV